jgi:hypothetical protein
MQTPHNNGMELTALRAAAHACVRPLERGEVNGLRLFGAGPLLLEAHEREG